MWLKLRTKYDFDNKNMEKTMWKTQGISHMFTCFFTIYPCLIYRLSCCIYRSNRSGFWSGLDALQLGHDVLGCGHPGLVVSLEKRRFIDLDGKPPSKNNITMENKPFESMYLLIIYIYGDVPSSHVSFRWCILFESASQPWVEKNLRWVFSFVGCSDLRWVSLWANSSDRSPPVGHSKWWWL